MPSQHEEYDDLVKQREKHARQASTRVPNLASLVNDSPSPRSGARDVNPRSTSNKLTQQEHELQKRMMNQSKNGQQQRPTNSFQPTPKKMTQQEQDLLMKQREREARGLVSRSQMVPNLGSKLSPKSDNPHPTLQVQSSKGLPEPPTFQQQRPAFKISVSSQQKEATVASRRTSSKVRNLAEKLSPTASAPRGTVNSPSFENVMLDGPPMISREERDTLIKQREAASRRASSKVQNLAEKLSPTASTPRGTVKPPARKNMLSGPPISQQENRDAQLKRQEAAARRTSSKVANLAEKLSPNPSATRTTVQSRDNTPSVGSPSLRPPNASYSPVPGISRMLTAPTTRSMSREEEDARAKRREQEDRRAASSSVLPEFSRLTTSTPAPPGRQERDTTSSSLQARYHAAGLALGIEEDGADLMMQGDIYGSHHDENPPIGNEIVSEEHPAELESEETIRARYRAAAVALGGGTQEDEDMQIKARAKAEAEAARRPPAYALATRAESGGDLTRVDPRHSSSSTSFMCDTSLSSDDARAKLRGRRPTQSAIIDTTSSSHSREDAAAKSRGSIGEKAIPALTENNDVVAGEIEPDLAAQQVITPGAFACNMGEREQLRKPILPVHPEIEPLTETHPQPPPQQQQQQQQQVVQQQQYDDLEPESDSATRDTYGETIVADEETTLGRSTEINAEVDEEAPQEEEEDRQMREPPMESYQEEELKEEQGGSKRKWIWAIALLLVLAIAGGVGGALAAGGSSSATEVPNVATTDRPTAVPTVNDAPDLIAARSILSGVVSSASSFADRSSPQSRALSWIANEDEVSEIPESGIDIQPKFLVRYVLAVFYFSLEGSSWLGSSGWLDVDTDECGWEHIQCNSDGSIAEIIEESGSNFVGTLPSELQHLKGLSSLHVENNRISAIAGPMGTSITSLHLNENQIEGRFPDGIFEMTSLTSLDMESNGMTGTLSRDFENLNGLEYLSLRDNTFTGLLTDEFKSLKNLERLLLSSNSFEGNVNNLIDGLSALQYIDLRDNSFFGTLDQRYFQQLTNLQRFEVASNRLSGTFPTFLSNATELLALDLSNNEITGSLPTELGQLTLLQEMRLARCSLEGSIPSEISRLGRLRVLTMEFNKEIGSSIPTELGRLGELRTLSIQSNNLTGTIPTELGRLRNLKHLLLEDNDLTGTLPAELATLSSLEELRLSFNEMSGSVPEGVCALPSLRVIYVEQSGITCDCGPKCVGI